MLTGVIIIYQRNAANNNFFKKKFQALERLLHARQLGLKLIANVTFGYTSANFSGRMPCMEVGSTCFICNQMSDLYVTYCTADSIPFESLESIGVFRNSFLTSKCS